MLATVTNLPHVDYSSQEKAHWQLIQSQSIRYFFVNLKLLI